MAGIFGTDGVRARINTGPMRAEAVVRLALAAGRWFADNNQQEGRSTNPVVVIGKDTRLSGYMLESALVAGFTSIGINCRLLGPVPTAAVSYLTHSMRADFGVMISASHNPHQDNGIKLFGPDGAKLADKIELEISELMQGSIALAEPDKLGRARRIINSAQRYMEAAKATFDTSLSLGGLHLVVDCAHGAAYRTAPETLVELGADILPMGVAPDGLNINLECGATAPEGMARAVREAGADIGICLDGDADRLILADEKGRICDGDQILAALAIEMKENGRLKGPVIGTVMSNLGLERFLANAGIDFQRAAVGDRYIAVTNARDRQPAGRRAIRAYPAARADPYRGRADSCPSGSGHSGKKRQKSLGDFIQLYACTAKAGEFARYGQGSSQPSRYKS